MDWSNESYVKLYELRLDCWAVVLTFFTRLVYDSHNGREGNSYRAWPLDPMALFLSPAA